MLSVLLEVLPWLAGIPGGKIGEVISIGTKVAKDVLGTDDPVEVGQKLSDPATLEAFKARLEQETEQLQAGLADVQDARHQTVALAQSGSAIAWAPVIISGLVLCGFLGITGALLFKSVPDSQIAMVLFGQLAGMTGAVVQYWLGSSVSSRSKDALLASLAGPTVPQVVKQVSQAIKGRK